MNEIYYIKNDKIKKKNIKNGIIILDFWAKWCFPCNKISLILDNIFIKYKNKIKIFKINIDENPNITNEYNISSIPTLIFLINGVVFEKSVGFLEENKMIDIIEKCLNKLN